MRGLVGAIVIGIWTALTPAYAAAPRVVASIKPLHALVAGVMEGVGLPDVLIKGSGSLHAYALRPSEAELLHEADIVFWVGPVFETFLTKPLAALAANAQTVALIDAPGVKVLRARAGGVWGDGAEDGGHDHAGARDDGHIWLSPSNTKAMVAAIAQTLSARDQANAVRYHDNAAALTSKLDRLDADLRRTLMPMRNKPFIAFHDAYQYFEAAYGLKAVGSITVTPERAAGARRIAEIRDKISGLGSICVFSEPQFEPKLVQTLVSETQAKTGVLDPEGSTLAQGPDLYFNLMRNLADNLVRCLATS